MFAPAHTGRVVRAILLFLALGVALWTGGRQSPFIVCMKEGELRVESVLDACCPTGPAAHVGASRIAEDVEHVVAIDARAARVIYTEACCSPSARHSYDSPFGTHADLTAPCSDCAVDQFAGSGCGGCVDLPLSYEWEPSPRPDQDSSILARLPVGVGDGGTASILSSRALGPSDWPRAFPPLLQSEPKTPVLRC